MVKDIDTATLAGGCFWCTEALFQRLNGVISVTPGYTGGTKENPTYEQVCSGTTGHAESVQITFNPSVISFSTLLDVFFALHDPTTLNQQGHDVGTQYRSAIFYHSDDQKKTAEEKIKTLNKSTYKGNIVTEVTQASPFYSAEAYHKDYFSKNSYQPYCQVVIDPKMKKLMSKFQDKVKDEYKKY